jgi:hypothetical protein
MIMMFVIVLVKPLHLSELDKQMAAQIYGPPKLESQTIVSSFTSRFILKEGDAIISGNGRYRLVMQLDGNLVMYSSDCGTPVWASNTCGRGRGPYLCILQEDGNLVVYQKGTCSPSDALWSSRTHGKGAGPYRLAMQDDRNIVLYDAKDAVNWASNTCVPSVGPFPSPRNVGSSVKSRSLIEEGIVDATRIVRIICNLS